MFIAVHHRKQRIEEHMTATTDIHATDSNVRQLQSLFVENMAKANRAARTSLHWAWSLEASQCAEEDVEAAKIATARESRESSAWDVLRFACNGTSDPIFPRESWDIVCGSPIVCPKCECDNHTESSADGVDAVHVWCGACNLDWRVDGVGDDTCPECEEFHPEGLSETKGEEPATNYAGTPCCSDCAERDPF